jgi:hypothetical protein
MVKYHHGTVVGWTGIRFIVDLEAWSCPAQKRSYEFGNFFPIFLAKFAVKRISGIPESWNEISDGLKRRAVCVWQITAKSIMTDGTIRTPT